MNFSLTKPAAARPKFRVVLRLRRPIFFLKGRKNGYSLTPVKGPHPQGRTVYDLNVHCSGWKVIMHAHGGRECEALMKAIQMLRSLPWMPVSYRIILDNGLSPRISETEAAAAYGVSHPYTQQVILNEPTARPRRFSISSNIENRERVEYWLNLAFHPNISGGGLEGYYRQRRRSRWL